MQMFAPQTIKQGMTRLQTVREKKRLAITRDDARWVNTTALSLYVVLDSQIVLIFDYEGLRKTENKNLIYLQLYTGRIKS